MFFALCPSRTAGGRGVTIMQAGPPHPQGLQSSHLPKAPSPGRSRPLKLRRAQLFARARSQKGQFPPQHSHGSSYLQAPRGPGPWKFPHPLPGEAIGVEKPLFTFLSISDFSSRKGSLLGAEGSTTSEPVNGDKPAYFCPSSFPSLNNEQLVLAFIGLLWPEPK